METAPGPSDHENSASKFHAQTHRNALRDPQIPLNAKHKFGGICHGVLFLETAPSPPEHEK
jgi:hypothetical protein